MIAYRRRLKNDQTRRFWSVLFDDYDDDDDHGRRDLVAAQLLHRDASFGALGTCAA